MDSNWQRQWQALLKQQGLIWQSHLSMLNSTLPESFIDWQKRIEHLLPKPKSSSDKLGQYYQNLMALIHTHWQQVLQAYQREKIPTSVEEQIKLWIVLAEDSYKELLQSEAYAKAYGDVCNAWFESKMENHHD